MNLYFRLIWMLMSAWRKEKLTLFETGILKSIVLPNDLDANMHMNNGLFLSPTGRITSTELAASLGENTSSPKLDNDLINGLSKA